MYPRLNLVMLPLQVYGVANSSVSSPPEDVGRESGTMVAAATNGSTALPSNSLQHASCAGPPVAGSVPGAHWNAPVLVPHNHAATIARSTTSASTLPDPMR